MAWFWNLKPHSKGSRGELCKHKAHFISFRKQPNFVDSLAAIYHNLGERVKEYLERFNKQAIQVHSADKEMKMYRLRKRMTSNTKFIENIKLDNPKNFNHLVEKEEKYRQYKKNCWRSTKQERPETRIWTRTP